MTNNDNMLPVGYMYKMVKAKPDWIKTNRVTDVYSVSHCISSDFMDDWINQWRHNGYWLFNSPQDIEDIAENNKISLKTMTLFFIVVTNINGMKLINNGLIICLICRLKLILLCQIML